MRLSTIILSLSAALLTNAQNGNEHNSSYIAEVCQPTNSSGLPDMNVPCNQVMAIQSQCMWGRENGMSVFYGQFLPSMSYDDSSLVQQRDAFPELPAEQSISAQRDCMCESQVFELMDGCVACQRAHGSKAMEAFFDATYISKIRADYCAASATPTVGLANFLYGYATDLPASISSAIATASRSPFSDPIGSKTEVSWYFTPSVTGSAAYIVAEPTNAGAAHAELRMVKKTAGGQAAPTAGAHEGAAGKTEAAAIAGVFGIAGLVALL